jgi:hypothetical protein
VRPRLNEWVRDGEKKRGCALRAAYAGRISGRARVSRRRRSMTASCAFFERRTGAADTRIFALHLIARQSREQVEDDAILQDKIR